MRVCFRAIAATKKKKKKRSDWCGYNRTVRSWVRRAVYHTTGGVYGKCYYGNNSTAADVIRSQVRANREVPRQVGDRVWETSSSVRVFVKTLCLYYIIVVVVVFGCNVLCGRLTRKTRLRIAVGPIVFPARVDGAG